MGRRISSLTELTSVDATDLVPIVDVSDTSGHSTGTTKKVTQANFLASIAVPGSGDVHGPTSGTDNAIARFNGATGKTIQNSAVTVDDSGNIETTGSVTASNIVAVSPFVQNHNGAFYLKGERFRYVGGNYYSFVVGDAPQSEIQTIMDDARKKGITVMRTWAFDAGKPPTDSAGNFRFLEYPLGTNLLANPSVETNATGYGSGNYTAGVQDALNGSVFTRVNTDAQDGSWSMKQVSSWGTYDGMSYQVNVTAATDYVWTFWHKIQSIAADGSHFPPVCWVGNATNSVSGHEVLDGGIMADDGGVWHRTQLIFNSGSNTKVNLNIFNFGGQNTCYYDNYNLSVKGTPALANREATYAKLDMVLDEARKRGIKMVLSLADNNTSYDSKATYVNWANTIYGAGLTASFPYTGFFDSAYCRTMYKDFVTTLSTRQNTINGLLYKDDPTIFSIEDGNELRYDLFTSESGTQNTSSSTDVAAVINWIRDVGAHVRSKFPNHLHTFGDMAHMWQWVNGDVIANGSGYGVDYPLFVAEDVLDYASFHIYPTQGGGGDQLQKYGQHLGYPNAISGDGFRAQLQDFVTVAHAAGKPAVIDEIGMVKEVSASNTYYPLYPRHTAFQNFFLDWFDTAGGDGMNLWSLTTSGGGTYSVNLEDTGGEASTDNTNDTNLVAFLKERNDWYQFHVLASQGENLPIATATTLGGVTVGSRLSITAAGVLSASVQTTGITRTVSTISSLATAGATALTDYVYLVSGTTTLTLPTAVGNNNRYTIKNIGVNTVTIATTSAQTIDGSATATISVQYTSISVISDGSNWFKV